MLGMDLTMRLHLPCCCCLPPGGAEVPVTQIIDTLNDALGDQLIGQASLRRQPAAYSRS